MTKFSILPMALAVALASFAASAEQVATKVDLPLRSPATALEKVQARPDYAEFGEVRYDRETRTYQFRYKAKDGTVKTVTIDAVTGKEKG